MMNGTENVEIIIRLDTKKDQSADYFRPGDKFVPTDSNTYGIHEGHLKKITSKIKGPELGGPAREKMSFEDISRKKRT